MRNQETRIAGVCVAIFGLVVFVVGLLAGCTPKFSLAVAVTSVAFIGLGVLFGMLLMSTAKDWTDVDMPDRSARVDPATEGRRSGSGMPTLPAHVARMDDRPRPTFSQPAAKGFGRDQSIGCDVVSAEDRRRWTHDVKPWGMN